MTNFITSFIFLKKNLITNWALWLTFSLLSILVIINQLHYTYPDEFENILGGFYIWHGILPYTGFFTHHNPFAYFFASPITLITGRSFVSFRLALGLIYIAMMVGFYLWTKRRFGVLPAKISLWWIIFVVVGATYWWGQMLLADTLSAYLLVAPVSLLFWLFYKKESLKVGDIWLISIFSALTVLTTFTLMYAVAFIYLFVLIWFFKFSDKKLLSKDTPRVLVILITPYLIFLVYLLFTGSIKNYIEQAIIFNTQYYASLPGGVSVKNPLRIIVVIFHQFFINFRTALAMTKDLNFGSPFFQSLALANAVFWVYLAAERKFFLALFSSLVVIYSLIRSNPYTTAETDYQGMAYHLLSIFNGVVVLHLLWEKLKTNLQEASRYLYFVSFIFLGLYFFFLGFHLLDKAFDKAYQKYMGTQSLIYDRPQVATTLNKIINNNDYYFIGPFDFEDHLYMQAKLASKYIVVISAMDGVQQIQQQLLADLTKTQPKVMVFDTEMRIFGDKPGSFLMPYLNNQYFNLEELGAPCLNYKAATKWFGAYDFERHFFFRRDLKTEMINKLFEQKLIENVDSKKVPDFCRDRYREAF